MYFPEETQVVLLTESESVFQSSVLQSAPRSLDEHRVSHVWGRAV